MMNRFFKYRPIVINNSKSTLDESPICYAVGVVVAALGFLGRRTKNLYQGTTKMKGMRKIHKLITLFQVSLVLLSCVLSLLGVAVRHPLVHYAEYTVLVGLISIPLTSLVIGITVLLSHKSPSNNLDRKRGQEMGWFSWKRYLRQMCRLVCKPGIVTAKPCRKKPAY
ncbi:MAG: hypothetical protein AB2606_15250 [Candidatus Thiodiazotropha taylori]